MVVSTEPLDDLSCLMSCPVPPPPWTHSDSTPHPWGETQETCDMMQDMQTLGRMIHKMTKKLFTGMCVQVYSDTQRRALCATFSGVCT